MKRAHPRMCVLSYQVWDNPLCCRWTVYQATQRKLMFFLQARRGAELRSALLSFRVPHVRFVLYCSTVALLMRR